MAIIHAASGTAADMNAAIATAHVGDTIIIPAGTFSVNGNTAPINAWDGLTITGAGIGNTTIINTATTNYKPALFVDGALNGGQPFELSGVTFQGLLDTWQGTNRTTDLTNNFDHGVLIAGAARNVRIHDCRFTKFNFAGLAFRGSLGTVLGLAAGVVYNCQFFDNWSANMGYGVEMTGNGNATWAAFPNLASLMGTDKCIYIEDNDFQLCRHFVEENNGGVYVARNNVCQNNYPNAAFFDIHGLQSVAWPRGGRYREIYNNTCSNPNGSTTTSACDVRGGCSLVWGNSFLNVNEGFDMFLEQPVPNGQTYPALDQVGNPDPSYFWNNTGVTNVTIRATTGGIQPSSFWLQQNRDYFLSAAPGYTPLIYPHPLRAAPIIVPPLVPAFDTPCGSGGGG